MSEAILLRPGLATLDDWRAIYRGASVALDGVARADVEAGASALSEVLARNELLPPREDGDSASVAELLEKSRDELPPALVRLFVVLKLGSLGQGFSGIRWQALQSISDFLAAGLLPAVPTEGVSDRLALACLFTAMTGTGEVLQRDERQPAAKALKNAGLTSLKLAPQEKRALASGAQLSTAAALAGLFEAERVFQSALVTAALSASVLKPGNSVLHPRVHRLHRHRGQIDVATALRALHGGRDKLHTVEANGPAPAGEFASGLPFAMGACLDLLRQAGRTLEKAANAVTEDHQVLWQTGEFVTGSDDASSTTLAADLVALSMREIGRLAEQRIAAIERRRETAASEDDAGPLGMSGMAAGFVSENRQSAGPAGLNDSGARRLLQMAGTTALVLAIEAVAAARETSSENAGAPEAAARDLLKAQIAASGRDDEVTADLLAAAANLVRSGALAAAPGVPLPSIV
jgi:histidine ammonia-lyase